MTNKSDDTAPAIKNGASTRKNIRFQAEPDTVAFIDFNADKEAEFAPTLAMLVLEESYRGCGVVAALTDKFQIGARFRIKVGVGPVLQAEIRWRTELDSHVMRLGIMYLE